MAHQLKTFNDETFQATEKQWRKGRTQAAFPTEADQVMSWVASQMKAVDPQECSAYGMFQKGRDVADAVCEVVITRKSARSKWVKMIRLRLNPALDERIYEGNIEAFVELIEIYASAVAGVLKLKNDVNATTLKIYGRSAEQLNFLKLLGAELEKHKSLKDHSIQMNGRWLVIENA